MRHRMLPDRRRVRAQVIAHQILIALEPFITNMERLDSEQTPHRKYIYRTIFEQLFNMGVDIITDADRANAGLPMRDHRGITDEELQIIEDRMTEAMMRPAPVSAGP